MQIKLYNRKTFTIEAIRVTDENMVEVAAWCHGTIEVERTDNGVKKFIRVKVRNPITDKQTKAFAGDWVMKSKHGFKVYVNKAFSNSFEEQVVYTEADAKAHVEGGKDDSPTLESLDKRPDVVTEEQALKNLGARDREHAAEIKQQIRDNPPTNENPWPEDEPFFEQKAEVEEIVAEANRPIELTKEEALLKNIFEQEEPDLCEACLLEKSGLKIIRLAEGGESARLCPDCREVVQPASNVDMVEAVEDVVQTVAKSHGMTEDSARQALGFGTPVERKQI